MKIGDIVTIKQDYEEITETLDQIKLSNGEWEMGVDEDISELLDKSPFEEFVIESIDEYGDYNLIGVNCDLEPIVYKDVVERARI